MVEYNRSMTDDRRERRRFARYRKDEKILLQTAEGVFAARLFDYSPFGVEVRSTRKLRVHETARIVYDGMSEEGHVVWVRGNLAGIEFFKQHRGLLRNYALADLLMGLKLSGKTGTLKITSEQVEKNIYIDEGQPVFASSAPEVVSIVDLLVGGCRITSDGGKRVRSIARASGKKEGAVLVELGFLRASELPQAVQTQTEMTIRKAFRIVEGSFEFSEGSLPIRDIIRLRLSLADIIYQGIKTIEDTGYLERVLPPLDAVLSPSADPFDLYHDISLDAGDEKVLLLVNGQNNIRDILDRSLLDRFSTLKALHVFLSARIIEPGTEEIPDMLSLEEAVSEIVSDHDFLAEVDSLSMRCEDMGHYEILDVDSGASEREIKRAYYRKVKRYHPDRFFALDHEDLKNKLSRIFSRLNQAYSALSRNQIDTALHGGDARQRPASELARMKFEEAEMDYRAGRVERAISLFAQSVHLDGTKAHYRYGYGIALRQMKRYKEAEEALLIASRQAPANSGYLAELGHLYLALGLKVRARRFFDRALSISEDNERAKEGMAALEVMI